MVWHPAFFGRWASCAIRWDGRSESFTYFPAIFIINSGNMQIMRLADTGSAIIAVGSTYPPPQELRRLRKRDRFQDTSQIKGGFYDGGSAIPLGRFNVGAGRASNLPRHPYYAWRRSAFPGQRWRPHAKRTRGTVEEDGQNHSMGEGSGHLLSTVDLFDCGHFVVHEPDPVIGVWSLSR